MKISRLEATSVHGYLNISIDFLADLTFLTGLNGSGKTTALRLLMGLLAPSIEELTDISFAEASVGITDKSKEIEIKAKRTSEGMALSISTEKSPLYIASATLQAVSEARHTDDSQTLLQTSLLANPVFKAIRELSTPMFLGLDRRLHLDERDLDHLARVRRRDFEMRHRLASSPEVSIRRITDAILSDVNELVAGALSEIRAAQERLDEKLRNQILLDSFRYESTDLQPKVVPSRAALNKFRERQAGVEKAAAGLRLPVGDLQSALTSQGLRP